MCKLEEDEKARRFPPVKKYENPILDVKPKLLPQQEPNEIKPFHVDSILNPKPLPFEPSNGPKAYKLANHHHKN